MKSYADAHCDTVVKAMEAGENMLEFSGQLNLEKLADFCHLAGTEVLSHCHATDREISGLLSGTDGAVQRPCGHGETIFGYSGK